MWQPRMSTVACGRESMGKMGDNSDIVALESFRLVALTSFQNERGLIICVEKDVGGINEEGETDIFDEVRITGDDDEDRAVGAAVRLASAGSQLGERSSARFPEPSVGYTSDIAVERRFWFRSHNRILSG